MKSTHYSFLVLFFGLLLPAATSAQNGGLTLGGGFGTKVTSFGVQGGGFYHLREDIRVAGDVTYYTPNKKSQFLISTIEKKWFEFNANGQFGYIPEDHIFLYSLAGLNYSIAEEIDGNGSANRGGIGVNLGGGLDIKSSIIGFYGEVKYTLLRDQFAAFIGTRFYF